MLSEEMRNLLENQNKLIAYLIKKSIAFQLVNAVQENDRKIHKQWRYLRSAPSYVN